MGDALKSNFTSEYFTLKELANGVYAAIENKAADTGSNAGLVDMGGYTVAFDAFLNIDATKDLIKASESLTGRKPAILVNSHYHADHVVGNCMFGEDVKIISSVDVYGKILTDISKMLHEIQNNESGVLEEIEMQISKEKDELKLLDLKNDYKYLKNVMRPEVKLRLPDITFNDKLAFHGETRQAELICVGTAHSPGDVLLYLPDEKICFMGDLLFKHSHPWLGTGNPENLIKILEKLLDMDAEIFIPGHGDLAVKSDIELEIKYIKEILSMVEAKKAKGETADSVTLKDLSPEFRDWDGLCFLWNIDYLFKSDKK